MAFNIAIFQTLNQNKETSHPIFDSITQDERQFMDALGQRESSNNYDKINKFGYLGRYQFGEAALEELGYYKKTKRHWGAKNHWDGVWIGKNGIHSKQDFINDRKVQDVAAKELFIKNWRYIKSAGLHKHIGKKVGGVQVTKSGLIAGMHLMGLGGLIKFSTEQHSVNDGFGTNILEYIDKFKGYKLALKEPSKKTA